MESFRSAWLDSLILTKAPGWRIPAGRSSTQVVGQNSFMAKNKRKRSPKTVLKLLDLEQSRSTVLNSLVSVSSQRSYGHAIREFIEWYCSEPRLAFNKTVVTRYRIAGAESLCGLHD